LIVAIVWSLLLRFSLALFVTVEALYLRPLPFHFNDYGGRTDYLISRRNGNRALVGALPLSLGP
jgi:hypothetical protein